MKTNKIRAYIRLFFIKNSRSNISQLSSLMIRGLHSRDLSDFEKFKALEELNTHFEEYISQKEITLKYEYLITENIKDKIRFFNLKYK